MTLDPVKLGAAFVALADTLVSDYDALDFLYSLADTCVDALGVSAAGVMLADEHGRLVLTAASSGQMRELEDFEVETGTGPSVTAYRTGKSVLANDLTEPEGSWRQFAERAVRMGFCSAYGLPLRLREECLGALNLYAERPHGIGMDVRCLGQALADVATVSIINQRLLREARQSTRHVEDVLEGRLAIERAKGVVADRTQSDTAIAFERLRRYARDRNLRLREVARRVLDGDVRVDDIMASTSEQAVGASGPSRRRTM